jgi:uncharacterized tellurite resistance protein B-like protein
VFRFFKKTPRLSLLELCGKGYCAVVGESYYQDALRATTRISYIGPGGRHAFAATLVREPDNPYDANAIAVHSSEGKLGHLSREDAVAYGAVFEELGRRGYVGASCNAYLTGGELGKPTIGVVLRLATPRDCLAELRRDASTAADGDEEELAEASAVTSLEFLLGEEHRFLTAPLREAHTRRLVHAAVSADECWHPAGQEALVAGRRITGFVYVGQGFPPADDQSYWLDTEPSLIDPTLPVGQTATPSEPQYVWPLAYERLTPNQRAAYLDWLANGRLEPAIGGVYRELFVAGLERRALADARRSPDAAREVGAIVEELRRLIGRYGDDGRSYRLRSLLDILRVRSLEERGADIEPPRQRQGWEDPLELRVGLGAYARSGVPLPAEWALAWARCSSQSWLRTPGQRCPEEFESLFVLRYRERHANGLKLKALKRRLVVEHHPINPGLRGPVRHVSGLPDVVAAGHVVNPLRKLAQECTDELDAYSRYIGRHSDEKHDLRALSLLPRELLKQSSSARLDELRELIAPLTDHERVNATAGDLIALLGDGASKIGKREAVALARVLSALGAGIEPDVRFGGDAAASDEPVVLFRLPAGAAEAPTPEYTAAAALLDLAAAVAGADGSVSPEEERVLATHLASVPHLDEHERVRLAAHLDWLLVKPRSLRRVKARIAQLRDIQRETVVGVLLAIAGADGVISSDEVEVLRKLFTALGLEEALLYKELHALTTAHSGPVTVRPAQPGDPEYALPTAPEQRGVLLDHDLIQAKLAETLVVSALLAEIFAEDEPAPPPTQAPTPLGLDETHFEFLRRLGARTEWSKDEIQSLAAELRLLADGALELVNEAAFESVGAPLWQGEDPIYVDAEVFEQLLA